ncbi:MAG: acyltransferase family protein [Muribaculaceae bacterium]|nr:acyltransferase family protein [Muribaculaceae bacterium]
MLKSFIRKNFCRGGLDNGDKKRVEFIDLAKGICIILVVLFHSVAVPDIPNLDALRMPLYFVVSGLFIKDYNSFIIFLAKKTQRLIIPFFFFFLSSVILVWTLSLFTNVYFDPLRILDPWFSKELLDIPIWFLLALFWCNIWGFVLSKIRNLLLGFTGSLIFAFSGVLCRLFSIQLPLFLGSSLLAVPFFFLGMILGRSEFLYRSKYDKFTWIFALLFIGAGYAFYFFFDKPGISFADVSWGGTLILAYLNSALMVVGTLLVCKMIKWVPVVSYFGRYSIIVLGVHYLILLFGAVTVERLIGLAMTPVQTLIFTVVLCWLMIPVFCKFFPHVTAQKNIID